jgi:hypothetical protein
VISRSLLPQSCRPGNSSPSVIPCSHLQPHSHHALAHTGGNPDYEDLVEALKKRGAVPPKVDIPKADPEEARRR